MFEMFQLYFYTYLAALAVASCLAIIGTQLCARNQSGQILCLGQSSFFGIMLGFGLIPHLTNLVPIVSNTFIPLFFGLVASSFTFLICEKAPKIFGKLQGSFYILFYVVLQAISFLLPFFLPHAETHLLSSVIGDMVNISDQASIFNFGFGLLFLVILSLTYRSTNAHSFKKMVLGIHEKIQITEIIFRLISLTSIVIAIRSYGIIFCTVSLLAPTFLTSQIKYLRMWQHISLCILCVISGVSLGFLISMFQPQVPMTPVIVVAIVCSGIGIQSIFKKLGYS